jgi:enamine deaminase RidA (YjgF/YER057c/UK114 family)
VFKKEGSMSVERINPGPRMSQAVVHGNTVYLAGLTADDTAQDVKGQTKQILDKIDALLAKAGTDKSKLLSANIWLTDIKTWSQMNEVWDAWVSPGNTPARATVEAKLAAPGLVVEIMVQAAK